MRVGFQFKDRYDNNPAPASLYQVRWLEALFHLNGLQFKETHRHAIVIEKYALLQVCM